MFRKIFSFFERIFRIADEKLALLVSGGCHPNTDTFIGYEGPFFPLVFDRYISAQNRGRHTLILGMTGSGKSTTLRSIVKQDCLKPNTSVIVIDGKGDIDGLLGGFRTAFSVLRLGHEAEGDLNFNPLLGEVDQVVEGLMTALVWSDAFYQSCARDILTGYLKIMKKRLETPSLSGLLDFLADYSAPDELGSGIDDPDVLRIRKSLVMLTQREYNVNHSGLRAQLNSLKHSTWARVMDPNLSEGSELPEELSDAIEDAFKQPRRVYIGLQGLANVKNCSIAGKLILVKVAQEIAKRAHRGSVGGATPTVCVHVDEFANIAYLGFETIIAQARSTGTPFVLSTQTLSDLKRLGEHFARAITSNTACKIIHQLNDEQDADHLAKNLGTTETSSQNWIDRALFAIERTGLFQQFFNPTGRNTMMEDKFRYSPDLLKNLPTGHAVFEFPGSNRKGQARVRVSPIENHLTVRRSLVPHAPVTKEGQA